jgi:ComF family protein
VNVGRVPRILADWLLALVFPARCAGCGRLGTLMCPECLARVRFLPAGDRSPESLRGRLAEDSPLDGLRSAVAFDGPAREAIHQLKYDGRKELAPLLAGWMADCWQRQPTPVDAVAAVPLHSRRERQRGYNQSALLAHDLCSLLGAPLLDCQLVRVRETRPQVGLNAPQRRENVRDAFACLAAPPAGSRVVLVDDVATTGATLEACARALKTAGCTSVWGLTVARVSDKDG